MRLKISFAWLVTIIIIGAVIGSVLGQVLGLVLPAGVVKQFFLRSVGFGFSPVTLDLALISFTIGLSLKINVIGVIGIFLATYIFRWYR